VLFGEGGADTFVFRTETGSDLIADFQPGVDRIDLAAVGVRSFEGVRIRLFEVAGTSAVRLDDGGLIVILNVPNAALSAVDFFFG
jgi:Ca2+-binding RTX toxin-like protein